VSESVLVRVFRVLSVVVFAFSVPFLAFCLFLMFSLLSGSIPGGVIDTFIILSYATLLLAGAYLGLYLYLVRHEIAEELREELGLGDAK